jgi:hypothetical protein
MQPSHFAVPAVRNHCGPGTTTYHGTEIGNRYREFDVVEGGRGAFGELFSVAKSYKYSKFADSACFMRKLLIKWIILLLLRSFRLPQISLISTTLRWRIVPSEVLTPASTPSSLPLGRRALRPQISSPDFVGYSFRSNGVPYPTRR